MQRIRTNGFNEGMRALASAYIKGKIGKRGHSAFFEGGGSNESSGRFNAERPVSGVVIPKSSPRKKTSSLPLITGMEREELRGLFVDSGDKAFRADQVLDWIYEKRVASFEAMTNLGSFPKGILTERFDFSGLETVEVQGAKDATRKFLFRLRDGRFIETVLIPASPTADGGIAERRTLCVSSQVGCAFDCKFCASGLAGLVRNLESGEIVEQVLAVEAASGEAINNIVFMGMGEPMANLNEVMSAIRILNADWGVGIGARRMTVSTSGLAPQIRKFADQPLQVRLAVSLHGASDEAREKIMPVNKRFPLEDLFESLRYFREHKKQRITFEYILIAGVNDSLEEAERLVERARDVNAKVNLIPYNIVEGLPWERPSVEQQEAFRAVLRRAGVASTLRREKGHDIEAACGQLRLREEEKAGNT